MRIIVNADDFGYSADVNSGILKAMQDGLISSTTILPNMPGFDEALEFSKMHEFHNKVGIHLNLFEGEPMTSDMRRCRVFANETGNFHQGAIKFSAPLKIDRAIIFRELHAQIDKVITAGLVPTHIDSHAHRHTNVFIGSEVIKLAKLYNIPAIRISPNIRNGQDVVSNIKPKIFNLRLKLKGIVCVDYCGSITDAVKGIKYLDGTLEVITHPVIKDAMLKDCEFRASLKELLAPLSQYELISYSQL